MENMNELALLSFQSHWHPSCSNPGIITRSLESPTCTPSPHHPCSIYFNTFPVQTSIVLPCHSISAYYSSSPSPSCRTFAHLLSPLFGLVATCFILHRSVCESCVWVLTCCTEPFLSYIKGTTHWWCMTCIKTPAPILFHSSSHSGGIFTCIIGLNDYRAIALTSEVH